MKRAIPYIAALSLLMVIASYAPDDAAEREITLDIAVTNPSADESQEVAINTDLPAELKKTDIITTDGLELKFNSAAGCLSVEGKVNLQPSETTFYYIKTRDVWAIPADDIRKIREEASKYPEINTPAFSKRLDVISLGADAAGEPASAHIAAYRKNNRDLELIKEELRAARSSYGTAKGGRQAVFYAVLLVIVAAVSVLAIFNKGVVLNYIGRVRKFIVGERRKFVRLPNSVQAKCRLIDQNESTSFRPTNNISNGGVAIYLEKPYKPNSLVELQLKMPDIEKTMTFNGFVVWLQKTVGPDKKEIFLTGISFAEAQQEDAAALKEYIDSRLRR